MTDKSDTSWSLIGKILLSVFHVIMGAAGCAISGMLSYDAVRHGEYHPELWIGTLAGVLGLYAFATALSIWNDSRPVFWALGILIMVAGLLILLCGSVVEKSVAEQSRTALRLVVFSISAGVVLTGISMSWWNEKHATIYCRYRMHLGGVILNTLVAFGMIWVFVMWKPRGNGEFDRTLYVTFFGLQIIWLVTLFAATRRFPRQPKDAAGKTACYRA